MKYIQRQSTLARGVHWLHMLATLSLFVTGVFIFVPSFGSSLSVDSMQVSRLVHRGAAIVFIAIPLIAAILQPKAFAHKVKEYFKPWTAEDKEFMRKFLPYLFSPKKTHMPKQDRYKSGQLFADGLIIIFAILIAISGAFMWGANYFAPGLIRLMYVVHDVSMVFVGVLLLGHIYLGAGIFQPYRGTGRLMFGDGKVSVPDAQYHWGNWADEEVKDGKNVVDA